MMYESDERKMYWKLQFLVLTGKLKKEDCIILFGAGENTKILMKMLLKRGFSIEKIVDNDRKKIGSYCSGILVESPSVIRKMCAKRTRVLFYSYYGHEITNQLEHYGLKANESFFSMIDQIAVKTDRWYIKQLCRVLMGMGLYRKLKTKYGMGCSIFVCPYTGTGDIYLIGSLLNQYLKEKNIRDYVFVVVSAACRKTAQIFGIPKIVQVTRNQADRLVKANVFAPEACNITVLNDSWASIYTNRTEWLRGYKGLNFTDMFRYGVFELREGSFPHAPEVSGKYFQEASHFLKKEGFPPGKTVILAPYSNTLSELPNQLWEHLAMGLKKKGYSVCTNSCGAQEPAIKGTEAAFFPLHMAIPIVSMAGGFIGTRSGLCDIISSSKGKKVIIYEKDSYFYQGTTEEYFGLKRMGLCQDAVELFYQGDVGQTVGRILMEF